VSGSETRSPPRRGRAYGGSVVPLGYRVENRALHVVEEHAASSEISIRRYLEIGSVVRLKAILDQEDARSPLRIDGTGKTIAAGSSAEAISTSFCRTLSTSDG